MGVNGGATAPLTRSAFGVNITRRWRDFTDGTSHTLLMSEVKNYQPNVRDCGGGLSNINDPHNVPSPDADPMAVAPEYLASGCAFATTGHTQWPEVSVVHNGFTTAWPPNKATPGGPGGATPDVDIIGVRERVGGPTFAAVTSRSHHAGGVHALFGDGSVKFVSSSINGHAWRAAGSIGGGETTTID